MADITFEQIRPLVEHMPPAEVERLRKWLDDQTSEAEAPATENLTWGQRLVEMVNQFDLDEADQMDIDDPEAWVREYRRGKTQRTLTDLHFEIVQLLNCINALLIKRPDLTNIPLFKQTIRNALLESWLLHIRNLAHFFGNERVNDEVLSEDYGFPHRKGLIADELKIRINENLSHLTYFHVQHHTPTDEWNPADGEALLSTVRDFGDFMLRNHLKNAAKLEIRKWEDLLQGIDMTLLLLPQP